MIFTKFNIKIYKIFIKIANNSIDQRSRSYDNSEVSQDYLKWRLASRVRNLASETWEQVRKISAKHVSSVGLNTNCSNINLNYASHGLKMEMVENGCAR